MGKKQEKKTAKGRLDKFYWLAKEQGYRSRAAFKLVQLNKKFNFLEKARCCIDLCAAPGGWLQVASKFMPPNSLIVGVDLVPIKPIPRCITFAEDINSYKCRDQLRNIMKDWKADVVIHDGAPNVGTAWVQDAYAQSELTLQSLRLAVEFLTPGGTFVSKVFRSKDYNNLLWVFNQLFKKVEATKPASSRNVSAEIFVVCQGYKAPSRVDPKFLDPTHVFKELDPTALASEDAEAGVPLALKGTSAGNAQANVFAPKKVRKHREGYADGDYTLFHSLDAMDFIKGQDVVGMLGSYNEISFKRSEESKKLLALVETTDEMVQNCADLKVLGRKDFRNLMAWRKEVRLSLKMDLPKSEQKDLAQQAETVEVEEMDEDDQIDDELARLNEEAARRVRKERRRRNELRQKKILKMQLSMTTPMDIGMDVFDDQLRSGADDFFDLGNGEKVPRKGAIAQTDMDDGDDDSIDGDAAESGEDDAEARARQLDAEMDAMYDEYKQKQSERDAKFRAKEARAKDPKNEAWHGIKDDDEEDESGEESEESDGGYDLVQKRKEQEETFDTDDEEDEEDERMERAERRSAQQANKKRKRANRAEAEDDDDDEEAFAKPSKKTLVNSLVSDKALAAQQSREASIWFDNPLFKDLAPELNGNAEEGEDDEDDEEDWEEEEDDSEQEAETDAESVSESGSEEDDFEVVPQDQEEGAIPEEQWDVDGEDIEAGKQKKIKDHGLATAEAVALAQALVNGQVTKEDLVDQGFSKHNFVDKDGLPTWFLDDEQKHYKANIPITKEAVQALRERQRALDARPIKKVAEAKARKKMRALQRLEKAQKKADAINENEDISEKEKSSTINKLLAKSMKSNPKKKKEVQLVVAKGVNRGLKGRPKGTKGRYKMVDPRMKKELRAVKRKNKKEGKKVGSSNSKPRIPKGYGARN
ncbi:AdoMet-dependent rRNA methyltransferase SPB1 [Testicularia cyperi]|uniref:AdoMet-dependent rRNA methyltransferase SPB1 n=1 Tax=Testicularia cyperi TaxID=1882483 RepID=A0A317XVZ5_9BASI|nr:AdoMet-dependent rRNA methyltransferase SPB1 [Testicularia cyperi]